MIVTIGADSVVVAVPSCCWWPCCHPYSKWCPRCGWGSLCHHLGCCRSYCFTGVSAAVGVRAVACIHAIVFCLQLIVCLLLLFSHCVCSALASFPAAAGVLGLLLKAAFCCRLCYSWLKNNIGKTPQDVDPHGPTPHPLLYAREGR